MVHRVDYMGLGSGVQGLNSDLGVSRRTPYISVLNRTPQIRLQKQKANPHMSPRSPSNTCLGQLPTMNIDMSIYTYIHMYIFIYIYIYVHRHICAHPHCKAGCSASI